MTDRDDLPDYAPQLAAYHRAFAAELRGIVGTLPIRPGDRVLDMACGDGAYLPWLADQVGEAGSVIGLDASAGLLRRAEARAGGRSRVVRGTFDRMPFPPGSFDLAWCAQSLFSLPDPVDSVRRMVEAVRPGGTVAVLEDDSIHQVLLPWPADVELAVRAAEWASLAEEVASPRKFYVGRRLVEVMRRGGLRRVEVKTFAADRIGPIDDDCRAYLDAYLAELRGRVLGRLDGEVGDRFDRLTDPGGAGYMLADPDFFATIVDRIARGVRPGETA